MWWHDNTVTGMAWHGMVEWWWTFSLHEENFLLSWRKLVCYEENVHAESHSQTFRVQTDFHWCPQTFQGFIHTFVEEFAERRDVLVTLSQPRNSRRTQRCLLWPLPSLKKMILNSKISVIFTPLTEILILRMEFFWTLWVHISVGIGRALDVTRVSTLL